MGRISQEVISEAEKADIVSFCEEQGYPLDKKSDRYYFGVEHDSLVIDRKKNKFHWNSQNISGNSIVFVQTFFDKSFPEAVAMLTSKEYEKMNYVVSKPQQEYVYDIEHDTNTNAVEKYLINERGIDKQIVSALINKGLIRQDKRKNCVFVWGATGKRVGSDLQGTIKINNPGGGRSTFKQISKNSKPNYGFNVTLGVPKALYFFESPIDLMSYWSLNKYIKDCRLISMNGLKGKTVMNMINHTYVSRGQLPINGVFLGVDNDVAGHKFVDKLEQMLLTTKDGQQINFSPLIPNDTQIPKEYIPIYQDAAIKFNVDWKYIAAIHKVETNLSNTNEIANNFNYGKFFGKDLDVGEKPTEINIVKAVNSCAEELAKHMNYGSFDIKLTLQNDNSNLNAVYKKVLRYYEAYNNLGILPTNKPIKDWNEKLQDLRRHEQAKVANKGIYNSKNNLNRNKLFQSAREA